MELIKDYSLLGELKNDKSGYSKWGFATKNNVVYFIKQFLSPVYPIDDSALSVEQSQRKRKICDDFENDKLSFYSKLSECDTGNNITVREFFRNKSKYYIVTEKVDSANVDIAEIARFSEEQKYLLAKVLLNNVAALHDRGIVHGDIKHDNVLLKRTETGMYTAKLIDFDSSFFESQHGGGEGEDEIQGDMVYLAPETFIYMAEGSCKLTTKIDVFALGILLHLYFSGEFPGFDGENYDYIFEATLDGAPIHLSRNIPEFMRSLIRRMLSKNPEDRPTARAAFGEIQNFLFGEQYSVSAATSTAEHEYRPSGTTVVTGTGLKIRMGTGAAKSSGGTYAPPAAPAAVVREDTYFKKADDLL